MFHAAELAALRELAPGERGGHLDSAGTRYCAMLARKHCSIHPAPALPCSTGDGWLHCAGHPGNQGAGADHQVRAAQCLCTWRSLDIPSLLHGVAVDLGASRGMHRSQPQRSTGGRGCKSQSILVSLRPTRCRDRPTRPFRCLDAQYRRELVRVYLTNVEGICRRFVEERKETLQVRFSFGLVLYAISRGALLFWCDWKSCVLIAAGCACVCYSGCHVRSSASLIMTPDPTLLCCAVLCCSGCCARSSGSSGGR